MAIALAGVMTFSLAACGSSNEGKREQKDDKKLTIWAWDEALILKRQTRQKRFIQKIIRM